MPITNNRYWLVFHPNETTLGEVSIATARGAAWFW